MKILLIASVIAIVAPPSPSLHALGLSLSAFASFGICQSFAQIKRENELFERTKRKGRSSFVRALVRAAPSQDRTERRPAAVRGHGDEEAVDPASHKRVLARQVVCSVLSRRDL